MKSDLLDGNHALLRKESFGGTLFFVKSGKRTYVSLDEFATIVATGSLPETLARELEMPAKTVVVVEPNKLYSNNFSAPDTVFMEVTRACNLICAHCFNDSGKILPNQLTQKQFEDVIDDIAATGVQEIRFTGGEPLVFPGIISLIKHASTHGIRCSIGTNATLITERKADDLKIAGLRAGIVSLDGLEKRHDQIRGHSSFRFALTGLERLRAQDIDVRVNFTAMRSNLPDLLPLIEMLSKRGIAIFIRRLILSGRATSSSDEMLSETDYANLRSRLRYLFNDPRKLVDGHYLKQEHITTRIILPFARKDCSAGHRGLVVLPDGKVQICGFLGPLGEASVGVLPLQKLADVWSNLNDSTRISKLEGNLSSYNSSTSGPKTNCLAVALARQK